MTIENQNDVFDDETLEVNSDIEKQYIINVNKFIFLSIVSLGIYEIWWIYKAWRFFQQKEKSDIMPAARAIFSIFFLISLFNKILTFAREKGYTFSYSSVLLFVAFLVCNLLTRLPDPFWLISIISFVFLIPPFKALNYAKQSSTDIIVIEQTSFSGKQVGIIVFGIIFWILILFAMMAE